jgi:hypothetical protein
MNTSHHRKYQELEAIGYMKDDDSQHVEFSYIYELYNNLKTWKGYTQCEITRSSYHDIHETKTIS